MQALTKGQAHTQGADRHTSLIVISSSRWVAETLAGPGIVPVVGTLGLDAPEPDGSEAFWCPGSYANRMTATGINHPFLSTGARWLETVPKHLLRRTITAYTMGELANDAGPEGFWKLAEAKHSAVPADIHASGPEFALAAHRALSPLGWGPEDFYGLQVLHSERAWWRREYRCFVAHGRVVSAGMYLSRMPGMRGTFHDVTWDAWTPEERLPPAGDATAFAQNVLDEMGPDAYPPGFVLDVGEDLKGNWSVIEANASWSSNPYRCDPAGVVRSILASQEPGNERWAWHPDPGFARRARALPAR